MRWRSLRLDRRAGRWIFALVAILCGALWADFFAWGGLRFDALDWVKEVAYLEILREALSSGRIPWHALPEYQETRRFLGNPETPLTPQVLSLLWLEVPAYIVANWIALYALGAWGCFLLARHLRLSIVPALFLLVGFSWNGHIVAHVAVGHSMWSGYFFLPLYALALIQLRSAPRALSGRRAVALAVVLAAVMAQGAFHITSWLVGFAMLACARPARARRGIVLALGVFLGLTAYRWAPALVAFAEMRRPPNHGFPSLEVLMDALITIRDFTAPAIEHILWWEYDVYLGPTGALAMLLLAMIGARRRPLAGLVLPAVFLGVLSLGELWPTVAGLPIPFVHAERGPTRFLIVTLFFGLVLAAAGAGTLTRSRAAPTALLSVVVARVAYDLWMHQQAWRIANLERHFGQGAHRVVELLALEDEPYVRAFAFGSVLSLLTLAGLGTVRLALASGRGSPAPAR